MTYYVEVVDPPEGGMSKPLRFKLGPFSTRDAAEEMAQRARATNSRSVAKIIENA